MADEAGNNNAQSASLRLESIISSAMDAIISIDADQRIILFNPAAERMFGVSADHAIGEYINRFIPERFRQAHVGQVSAFGATGATHRRMGRLGAVRGLRANGQEFPAEASISHMDTPQGKIYTVIMRDISERVLAEEALRESSENLERLVRERTARLQDTISEMEYMSYSMIHDMRAPLRAIQSFAGILQEEASDQLSEGHRAHLEVMRAAASRMDALLRDMLAYSSVVRQDVPVEPLDPEVLLRSVLATYPMLAEHRNAVSIIPGIPKVCANEPLLAQCFANLLVNAVKFCKPGEAPRVEVSGCRSGESIRISFRDWGVGIPKEMHAKIFGIFQRLSNSHEGTGIGLAIVRKAIERMEGRVSIESALDLGSTFHLDIPPG